MRTGKNIVREQLRLHTANADGPLAFGSFGLSRTGLGNLWLALAAAEPRAAAARFRRLPTTILGPRRASLLAASRNLERFA